MIAGKSAHLAQERAFGCHLRVTKFGILAAESMENLILSVMDTEIKAPNRL